jgi:hypothetical protein
MTIVSTGLYGDEEFDLKAEAGERVVATGGSPSPFVWSTENGQSCDRGHYRALSATTSLYRLYHSILPPSALLVAGD